MRIVQGKLGYIMNKYGLYSKTVSPGAVAHARDFSICRWRQEEQGSRSSFTV